MYAKLLMLQYRLQQRTSKSLNEVKSSRLGLLNLFCKRSCYPSQWVWEILTQLFLQPGDVCSGATNFCLLKSAPRQSRAANGAEPAVCLRLKATAFSRLSIFRHRKAMRQLYMFAQRLTERSTGASWWNLTKTPHSCKLVSASLNTGCFCLKTLQILLVTSNIIWWTTAAK